MTNIKSDDFLFIEKCFSTIKSGVAVDENIEKIERTLKRIFDLDFHINIVDNNTNIFFGMNVYPAVDTMDRLVNAILNKKESINEISELWAKNTEWYIEIDSLLLNDMALNANPPELVSVLLHEVGHVINSNSIPQRLNKIFRMKLMSLNYQLRQLVINDKIRKLFNISVIEACETKNFRYIETNREKNADRFVIQYGYGEDLDHFLGKLIKTQGNSMINRTDVEVDKDLKAIVNWTINNIRELEFRKKSLRIALKTEILRTPSEFTRRVIQDIYESFFGESTDKYRVLLSEQYMECPTDVVAEMESDQILDNFIKRVVTESAVNIFDKRGKLKKITPADVDILTVEAERIDTTDDKIYLLDKLYGQYELVNLGLDYINSGDKRITERVTQTKPTLLEMKDRLEKLRTQILATKIIEKEYGVFIKYPKNYQG